MRELRGSRVGALMKEAIPRVFTKSLRSRIWEDDDDDNNGGKANVGPTTWMDGLRGCAALVVFNYHFLFAFTDSTAIGFGVDEQHRSVVELPFIRLLGLFEGLREMIAQKDVYFRPQFTEPSLRRCATLTGQLHFWLEELYKLSDVWRVGPFYPEHDPHLWTIGYEARMSMHLYITLVGLAKCKPRVRLFCLIGLALLYTVWNRWEGPLFFLGAALAQYHVIENPFMLKQQGPAPKDQLPGSPTIQSRTRHAAGRQTVRCAAYIFSLYLMSYPISGWKKPATGFTWINGFIPAFYSRKEKFPKSIGVLLFVFLLHTSRNPIGSSTPSFWHRLFTCRFARYLGQHMFALYLVHGTVLHLAGYGIPHLVWRIIGQNGAVHWLAGVTAGWVCS